MSTPLLQTKLYIPPPRPELVPRPRLIERLDDGLRLGHRPGSLNTPRRLLAFSSVHFSSGAKLP